LWCGGRACDAGIRWAGTAPWIGEATIRDRFNTSEVWPGRGRSNGTTGASEGWGSIGPNRTDPSFENRRTVGPWAYSGGRPARRGGCGYDHPVAP